MRPALTPLLRGSSEPFAGSFLTKRYSGMRLTWSESYIVSEITTIIRVHTRRWTATRPMKSAVTESRNLLHYTVTRGKNIATVYSNSLSQLE